MRFITIKKSLSWGARIALGTLVLSAPVRAQDASQPVAPVPKADAKPLQTKPETIGAGELRIDGKLTAILGEGVWQVEAVSWTSPRGVTVDFDDVKTKLAKVAANSLIHQRGQAIRIAFKTVKLGARLAIIGKNGSDGSLLAREVVLLEPLRETHMLDVVQIDLVTSQLMTQAEKARAAGQTTRALNFCSQALAAARDANDKLGQSTVLDNMGCIYLETEQNSEAVAAFKSSIELVKGTGREAYALNGLGTIYLQNNDYKAATEVLEEANHVGANNEPRSRAMYLKNLSYAYGGGNRSADAIRILERLFPLQEAIGEREEATETLISTAAYQSETRLDVARTTLEQALPRIPAVTDQDWHARLIWYAAVVSWKLGDQNIAKTQCNEAIRLFDELGNTKFAQAARNSLMKMNMKASFTPKLPQATAPTAVP